MLDGSIIPTSLGINPSLTIAALAYRPSSSCATDGIGRRPPTWFPAPARAPCSRSMPDPARRRPTDVEIIERMSGDAMLPAPTAARLARVELTLHFEPSAARVAVPADGDKDRPKDATSDADARSRAEGKVPMRRRLSVDRPKSRLRVFDADEWNDWRRGAGSDAISTNIVQFRGADHGSLVVHAARSRRRTATAVPGATRMDQESRDRATRGRRCESTDRELAREIKPRLSPPPARGEIDVVVRLPFIGPNSCRRLLDAYSAILGARVACGRGAPVRLRPQDHRPSADAGRTRRSPSRLRREARSAAAKRLTYSRRSNPWRQMARMSLDAFPVLSRHPGRFSISTSNVSHAGRRRR